MDASQTSPSLSNHRGFRKAFSPGRLTIGMISPIEGHPDSPGPTLKNHGAVVRLAEEAGAAAIWLRDVPFYDPTFGDVGQMIDPFVLAGWLASITRTIAIGTAGIVAPLRDPVITAKQIASADQLLAGRFIGGFASGDRALEYPAFGVDFESRAERYREALQMTRVLMEESFPRYTSSRFGRLDGSLDLVPKPAAAKLPVFAIGRAGQSMEWLAGNVDGWLWHGSDARRMTDVIPQWRELTAPHGFKPYGYGTWFDLDADPDAPLTTSRTLRAGRHALVDFLRSQQEAGLNHIALNLKPTRRPSEEVLEEMAKHVFPLFPAGDSAS